MGHAEQPFLARSEARQRRAQRARRGLALVAAAVGVTVSVGSLLVARRYQAAARLAHLHDVMRAAADANDPLVVALVLAEFDGQPEPPGRLAAAAELAAQPIPLAIYRSSDPMITAALSPDGRWAAVATSSVDPGRNGDVIAWRIDGSGRPIILHGHEKVAVDVRFSRDGSRVLTAGYDHTVRIWRSDGTGTQVVIRQPADIEDEGETRFDRTAINRIGRMDRDHPSADE